VKDTLTMEEMFRMINSIKPKPIHFQALNDYLAEGNSIKDLMFVTSNEMYKGIDEMDTTQGKLIVRYNPYLEKDKAYFFKIPEPLFKPRFPLK
jgi:hypothetical protein